MVLYGLSNNLRKLSFFFLEHTSFRLDGSRLSTISQSLFHLHDWDEMNKPHKHEDNRQYLGSRLHSVESEVNTS